MNEQSLHYRLTLYALSGIEFSDNLKANNFIEDIWNSLRQDHFYAEAAEAVFNERLMEDYQYKPSSSALLLTPSTTTSHDISTNTLENNSQVVYYKLYPRKNCILSFLILLLICGLHFQN
jgi:hypothetical protein